MRLAGTALLGLALVFALLANVEAGGDKGKEVKLEGKITCAKCDLGTSKKCETVIVVKKDNKDIVYYFDQASHKKHHGAICQEGKEGTVEGTATKMDDRRILAVKTLTYK
jgi:hypothetical protein